MDNVLITSTVSLDA
uniref:Uncharacterized protein n=1 Tax=Anguilla anguilla TaxID=7936 RepID=A0A0E9UU78_ANGAN